MPKPEPAPAPAVEAHEETTVTRRWTATPFFVEAARNTKGDIAVSFSKHGGSNVTCPRCDKPVQVPPQQLTTAELDGLIRLLSSVRDNKLKELEKFGVEE